jgi:hypothetical protein
MLAPHTGQVAREERSAARCCASTRGGDGAAAARSDPAVGVTKPKGGVGVTKPKGGVGVTKPKGAALRTNCRSEGWPGSARLRFAAAPVAEPDAPLSAYTSTSTRRLTRKGWVPTAASKVRVASAAMACASSFFAGGQATWA